MTAAGGENPLFLLTDNGSIRAASALALRSVAADLSRRTRQQVEPASLAHANRIPPEDLDGSPAPLLKEWLLSPALPASRPIVILPFFLANRGAIVRLVEKAIREVRAERPRLSVQIAPFLFEEDGPEQGVLARAAADRVREKIHPADGTPPNVVFVDHGSPLPAAAQVRNFVAGQVQALLGPEVRSVIPASMERREGRPYDFADPLLAEVLRRPVLRDRPVILSLFFLLPGRHAGENGDVAGICTAAHREIPSLAIRPTGLLGDHPLLLDALAKRVKDAIYCAG